MSNLASAVDELLNVDVREAPAAQLQNEVEEILRQRHRLDAAYLQRVEAIDRRGLAPDDQVNTQTWLRSAFRLSPSTARRDVRLGRNLADILPATTTAMADGDISYDHARLIASLRTILMDSALTQVEGHLVAIARGRSPHDLRKTVEYVKHAYAPDRAVQDEQELYEQRDLSMATTFDGAGVGKWTLPPASQETVETAIHAASAPLPGDPRSAGQRRADGLVTIAELALASGKLPTAGGVKPHVSLVLSGTVAAEPMHPRPLAADLLDDLEATERALRDRVVHTAYGAVISVTWARRFLCDAAVSRIVFDAAGEVLDAGRSTRTFTAAQVRAIVARDHDRIHLFGHAIVKKPSGCFTVDLRAGSDPRWKGPPNRAGP